VPFTYGTALRIFGKIHFYLQNDKIVEYLSKITTVIFDKTGTLTELSGSRLVYSGNEISEYENALIKSVARHSTHPVSRLIYENISVDNMIDCDDFLEYPGKGIMANIDGRTVKIGRKNWVSPFGAEKDKTSDRALPGAPESTVYIGFNDVVYGNFSIESKYRDNAGEILSYLAGKYKIVILSGDNASDEGLLKKMTGDKAELKFNQTPSDKLNYVQDLILNNENVLMIGDGLNDSGALKQSGVGIAVTESDSNFTPGSDAIILADKIKLIPNILKMAGKSVRTVYLSFALSFIYNIVGMAFAVQGTLSPVIAAILMPVSSLSVVLFTVGKVRFDAYRLKLK
jgi:Cu+-exporting ATPase